MNCFSPVLLHSSPYSGVMAPLIVPCGKCPACKKAKSAEWVLRLQHEQQYWAFVSFLTLTYSDEFLPHNPEFELGPDGEGYLTGRRVSTLSHDDLTNFFKLLRYYVDQDYPGRKIRYYAVGEYGQFNTKRPHYHAIIFGLDSKELSYYALKAWHAGFVYVSSANVRRLNYVALYSYKSQYLPSGHSGRIAPFSRMSQGLGLSWALEHAGVLRKYLRIPYGVNEFRSIPRYYVRKLEFPPWIFARARWQAICEYSDFFKRDFPTFDDFMATGYRARTVALHRSYCECGVINREHERLKFVNRLKSTKKACLFRML